MAAEPDQDEGKIIDLSGLDLIYWNNTFLKIKNKNAAVQSLKDKVEKQLKQMVERNQWQLTTTSATRKSSKNTTRGKDDSCNQKKLLEN